MESQINRQRPIPTQVRSNSISGQEFYHTNGGGYMSKLQNANNIFYENQQQRQMRHNQFNPEHSVNMQAAYHHQQQQQQQQQQHQSLQQPHQLNHFSNGRSLSPSMGLVQNFNHAHPRDGYFRYLQQTDRPIRNQLHASLECLNSSFTEYRQQEQQQPHHPNYPIAHDSGNLQPQQHQHYAASYVLAQPPVNAVINQNGDQDLAAAAMSISSQPPPNSSPNNSGANQQNFLNRAMAHVVSSPMRRPLPALSQHHQQLAASHSNQSPSSFSGTSLMNHLSASLNQHPIRAGHSSLSLTSSSFIIEDKLQNEIRKLHSELKSERDKNEALNNQLNINSSLMAAFEQSLTTLNTRLRQLTTLNEKKDNEIQELRDQLNSLLTPIGDNGKDELQNNDCLRLDVTGSSGTHNSISSNDKSHSPINSNVVASSSSISERNNFICSEDNSEHNQHCRNERNNLFKTIEDLKRQLIEKDRLLTDTRLEALSAAHQLEQLESKLNGENSLLNNNDDDLLIDEGVMVTTNHSPNDSDGAHTTSNSTNFSCEIQSKMNSYKDNCLKDSSVNDEQDSDALDKANFMTLPANTTKPDVDQILVQINSNNNSDNHHHYHNNSNSHRSSPNSPEFNALSNTDEQHSNHSSEYQSEISGNRLDEGQLNYVDSNISSGQKLLLESGSEMVGQMMENLLLSS